MPLNIEVFANSDDAFIAWRALKPIPDCIGFELRRRRNGKLETVRNRVSFRDGEPDPRKPESSEVSPLRRYTWTDHEVNSGDKVAYQVFPVIQRDGAAPLVDKDNGSPMSAEVELTGVVDPSFECYFNRGLVISQFASRFLKGDLSGKSLKKFKKELTEAQESKIRQFFGGDLRKRLIGLLDDAKKSKGHIFAALFEISDEELIGRLTALGARAHIVLANGAHKRRDDDENEDARGTLNEAGCEVFDRMLPSGVLGHNKFLILCDKNRKPLAAWTGSTNWAPTGLCTQVNNGILIHNPGVAQIFLDQWKRLQDAKDSTPKSLVEENSEVKSAKAGHAGVDVWFTRTSDAQEMDEVKDLIDNAKEGIVFQMFMPGTSPLLDAIVARQADQSAHLYVKGVISTIDKNELDQARVTLVRRGGAEAHKFRIVQPQGLHSVGKWAAEVSRGLFLSQVGHAIVHSKVIVIDPNGKNPIVVTGSHNFSKNATSKNDENLVIIRRHAALARAYAVHIQSVCDHYNFRAVAASMQEEGKDVVALMKDPKSWQQAWFGGDKQRELNFWLGQAAHAAGGGE